MRSKRENSLSRLFTRDETLLLAEYLKTDCKPDEDSDHFQVNCSGTGNPLRGKYSRYVDSFVQVLNKKSDDYGIPRILMRELWEAAALPKCLMVNMCTYVLLCIGRPELTEKAASLIEKRFEVSKQIKSTVDQLAALRRALSDEESFAFHNYNFPEMNERAQSILGLMSACTETVQEFQQIGKSKFSVQGILRKHALLMKEARYDICHCKHLKGLKPTAEIVERLLPVVHEAISGSYPDNRIEKLYDFDNMERDARRLFDELNVAKLHNMIEGFNKIIPGFLKRIVNEDLESIVKISPEHPISLNAEEIVALSDLHEIYTNSCNQLEFVFFLKDLFHEVLVATRKTVDDPK